MKPGQYLEKQWNTYSVVMRVPKDLQPMLGKTAFKKTLQTSSATEADDLKLPIIGEWKAQLKAARSQLKSGKIDIEKAVEDAKQIMADIQSDQSLALETVAHTLRPSAELTPETEAKVRAYGMATGSYTATNTYVIEWAKQKNYQPSVYDGAVSFLLKIFCKRFPYFETIDTGELKIWVDDLLQGRNGYPGWVRRTVNKNFGYLHSYWAYCEDKYTKAPNLAIASKILPPVSRTKADRAQSSNRTYKPFSDAEIFSLIDAAEAREDQNLIDLIRLGMYTGMRLSEICNMKVSDVGMDRFTVSDAKTYSGNREIPIHSDIQQLVERLKQTSDDGYLISGESSNNKYNSRTKGISHRFNRLKEKLGFEKKRHAFHSFRATLANRFESAGVPENFAARIIGHHIETMTYGTYSGGIDWNECVNAMGKVQYQRST